MLELQAKDVHHLDGGPGRACDGDGRVIVDLVHLLDVTRGYLVALGCEPVTGDQRPVLVNESQHGRTVRDLDLAPV